MDKTTQQDRAKSILAWSQGACCLTTQIRSIHNPTYIHLSTGCTIVYFWFTPVSKGLEIKQEKKPKYENNTSNLSQRE